MKAGNVGSGGGSLWNNSYLHVGEMINCSCSLLVSLYQSLPTRKTSYNKSKCSKHCESGRRPVSFGLLTSTLAQHSGQR